MKVSLQQAYNIIEQANAVIVADDLLVYPGLSDITGEEDNQFLYCGNGDYSYKFEEGANQEVDIVGSSMFLTDNEGDSIKITILSHQEVESELKQY